ncbi:NAD-dependent epimerase/dehydratase family protein, partial [Nocardia farcinica]
MKIVVFGATGMVGVRVAHEATARGHAVTAVARSGAHPVVPVDARDRDRVADLLGTADAAVGAVRPRPGA